MMTFFIVLFTAAMVLNSGLLLLLILVQLPKKEAGAALAFGGGASDALFGAGSGNMLTKITKWSAALFFVLALILSVMKSHERQATTNNLQKVLQSLPPAVPPMAPPVMPSSNSVAAATNKVQVEATNSPATNAVPLLTIPTAPPGTNTPKK